MTEQVGNPNGGIGLHEATLAIDQLLGPDEDTQDEAERKSLKRLKTTRKKLKPRITRKKRKPNSLTRMKKMT